MDSERSLFMIVAILLLIIAIRKAQRFRFIALNMYFLRKRRQHDLISALLTRGIRRIRRTHVQQRRAAWVYPRPQGWFEEMYQNPVFPTLWKNDFRVTKETFDYICQLVGPDLSRQNTYFWKAVALNKCVAIALWRMGTGNSYRTTGITFGQGKSTVIKICENFMEALICHKDNFIRFPDDLLDVTLAMRRSESLAGFPNVVGAIDGSHIAIKAPHVHHEDYFNRKKNYSINLQGVVDATGKFIDVSTGWPGSIHDARVLRLSTLYQRAENNLILTEPVKRINGVTVRPLLIGDSAYPLLPWLVSPYPHSHNLNRNQAKFNKILSKSRVTVERAFGKLKCHWRCLLKPLEEKTPKVPHTILTCCILHNICVLRADEFEDDHSSDEEDDEDGDDDGIAFRQGRIVRQALTVFLAEWTHFHIDCHFIERTNFKLFDNKNLR